MNSLFFLFKKHKDRKNKMKNIDKNINGRIINQAVTNQKKIYIKII